MLADLSLAAHPESFGLDAASQLRVAALPRSHPRRSAHAGIDEAANVYGRDFNPIETAFATRKGLLRQVAERTVKRLWGKIGALLAEFGPIECANFFAAFGYGRA